MSTINVNPTVVANNRTPISIIGSNLGRQYHKPEARETWPEFEKTELAVKQSGNVDLILNRAPRRYRMTSFDILNVAIKQDAVGATSVFLNEGLDGEVSIPVAPGMEQIGKVTEDAIGEALRGDENMIFADASALVAKLNTLNAAEKKRLVALRGHLDKFIQQIESTMAENEKKAQQYVRELTDSTPKNDTTSSKDVTIVIKPTND